MDHEKEKLRQYLKGMSKEDQDAFLSQYETDPELKKKTVGEIMNYIMPGYTPDLPSKKAKTEQETFVNSIVNNIL